MIELKEKDDYVLATDSIDDDHTFSEPVLKPETEERMQLTSPDRSSPEKDEFVRTCNGYSVGPISNFGLGVGVLFLISGILNFSILNLVTFVVDMYIIGVGVLVIGLEAPTFFLTRGYQAKIHKWARLTQRLWGRAGLYFLFATLLWALGGAITALLAGGIAMCCCIFLFYSITCANIAKEMDKHIVDSAFGDNLDVVAEREFQVFSINGNMGPDQLSAFVKSTGRILLSNEKTVLMRFFDEENTGVITQKQFIKGFHNIRNGIFFI